MFRSISSQATRIGTYYVKSSPKVPLRPRGAEGKIKERVQSVNQKVLIEKKGFQKPLQLEYSKAYKMTSVKDSFKLNETPRLKPTAFSIIDSMSEVKAIWKEMHTKPGPLGKKIWTNPKKGQIEAEVKALHEKDSKRGVFGFHCTVDKEEMLAQAKECPEGTIQYRENCHGEGLYIGDAESAAHFAGQKNGWIFRVASTCRYGTNSDYGTNTTYLTGGGKVYILEAYELNQAFSDYRKPWIWEVAIKCYEQLTGSKQTKA